MKPDFDCLLFDMDGVLVDVTKSYRTAIQKTAQYFLNRSVSDEEVRNIKEKIGMNNDWDASYALIGNPLIPYGRVKARFQKLYRGEGKMRGLIDNETLMLKRKYLVDLKKRYGKMGIVTGRPADEALYAITRFGIADLFDIVVTQNDTRRQKPYPDPILKAMLALSSRRAVYIGDSPSDAISAQKASVPCLYVGFCPEATICFDSIEQVYFYLYEKVR